MWKFCQTARDEQATDDEKLTASLLLKFTPHVLLHVPVGADPEQLSAFIRTTV
jgi:hypothetical protein